LQKKSNDYLTLYWANKYADFGLNSEQIKNVLGIKKSNTAFRRWLNRNGIVTTKTKTDDYFNLVKQNNL